MNARYWLSRGIAVSAATLVLACGPSKDDNGNTNNNNEVVCTGDADGDSICDEYEGRAESVDSDGDGTPDYLDTDSDGDGIDDATEWGGFTPGQAPRDSDGDGTPDFRDLDSDGNGISDADDGTADFDGDGLGDWVDLDDDNDLISDAVEIGEFPASPVDSDFDGVPDYHDDDSDGDTILDGHERNVDSDGDGVPDYLDLDSDEDGIPDEIEAGDADLNTIPVDSDGDGHPDFRDSDSDNDGLADGDEDINGNGQVDSGETDPHNPDSDGDGASDMVEVGAGTDPLDDTDNPQANGDFVFVVPYQRDATPVQDTLDFATSLVKADLYFLMDLSGSMQNIADNIKSNMQTTIGDALAQIPDLQVGIGSFLYAQCANYKVYDHRLDIQPDAATAQAIFPSYDPVYESGCSGGTHEPPYSALYSSATGNGTWEAALDGVLIPEGIPNEVQSLNAPGACPAGFSGYPCFRPGALPIVAVITDEAFDQYAGTSSSEAIDALATIGAKTIGIYGSAAAQSDMISFMTAQGSVDASGVPLVYDGGSASASQSIADAITDLSFVPMDISSLAVDNDDGTDAFGQTDTVDAVSEFVDYMVATDVGASCTPGFSKTDGDQDGHLDTFLNVSPGNQVCWDIYVLDNYTVPATEHPQLFTATINVYGNGVTQVDQRTIFFLVPPVIEGPGVVE